MENTKTLDLDAISSEIEFVSTIMMDNGRILIEMKDDRNLSEIAKDFEGNEKIERVNPKNPKEKVVYSGYTKLIEIRRNMTNGRVRLTLAQREA